MVESISRGFHFFSNAIQNFFSSGINKVRNTTASIGYWFQYNTANVPQKLSVFSFSDLKKYTGGTERFFYGRNYPLLIKTAMCVNNIARIRIDSGYKDKLPNEAIKLLSERDLASWFKELDSPLELNQPILLNNSLSKNKSVHFKHLQISERTAEPVAPFVDISWVLDGEAEELCQLKIYDSTEFKDLCRKVHFNNEHLLDLRMSPIQGVKKSESQNIVHPDFHPISFGDFEHPASKFLRYNLEDNQPFSFYSFQVKRDNQQSIFVVEIKNQEFLEKTKRIITERCSVARFIQELGVIMNYELSAVKEKLKIVDIK